MKKLLASLMLIFALSIPAFSGHVQGGAGAYCPCTPEQGFCPCCGGDLLTVANDQEHDSINQNASEGAEPALELGVIRMAFLIWLKIRA